MPITIKNRILHSFLLILCMIGAAVALLSLIFFIKYYNQDLTATVGRILFSLIVLIFFLLVIFKLKVSVPSKKIDSVQEFIKSSKLIYLQREDCLILSRDTSQGLIKSRWELFWGVYYDKSDAVDVFQFQFTYNGQTQVVQKYTDWTQEDLDAWFATYKITKLYINLENNSYVYFLDMPV